MECLLGSQMFHVSRMIHRTTHCTHTATRTTHTHKYLYRGNLENSLIYWANKFIALLSNVKIGCTHFVRSTDPFKTRVFSVTMVLCLRPSHLGQLFRGIGNEEETFLQDSSLQNYLKISVPSSPSTEV